MQLRVDVARRLGGQARAALELLLRSGHDAFGRAEVAQQRAAARRSLSRTRVALMLTGNVISTSSPLRLSLSDLPRVVSKVTVVSRATDGIVMERPTRAPWEGTETLSTQYR